MTKYHALRQLKENSSWKSGDVLVLFGELFSRGYANGLVEEAQKRGMKVISSTVGRRDSEGNLRALNSEELAEKSQALINIPLEAGFDLELDAHGQSIVDHLKDVKLNSWQEAKIPKESLDLCRKKGRIRFQASVQAYLKELDAHIPKGANVLFAHLMAGGVPRAKIILPVMNRIVKGTGDRFLSSERVLDTDIGNLMIESFFEVTAETFKTLTAESKNLREKIQNAGGRVSYLAYGYHGTEVLMGNEYRWQSYSPYFQGWAKMRLEDYAEDARKQGLSACVYNCPEILTNSSSIFSGVEVSLYPLMGALRKEAPQSPQAQKSIDQCMALLKPGISLDQILDFTKDYLTSDIIRSHCVFEKWPQHNGKEQLAKMLQAADDLINMHQDTKNLITFVLSEVVFSACGKIMLNDSFKPEAATSWINHDIIAKIQ